MNDKAIDRLMRHVDWQHGAWLALLREIAVARNLKIRSK